LIHDLVIKNFQSHKETSLAFDKGFNSIIGTTDSGKSAIYRSLYWLTFNKGANFISFWNRKKDGTPKEETFSTISTDTHCISRQRSPLLNAYILDSQVLEAVGRGDAPDSVVKALNLSDINFFSQHNPPFLLTESAGKVAEILNDLVHLSDIDRVLGNIDRIKRSTKRDLETEMAREEKLRSDKEALSWVEMAEPLLSSAKEAETGLQEVERGMVSLSFCVTKHKNATEYIDEMEQTISSISSLITITDSIKTELEGVMAKYNELGKMLATFKKLDESIAVLKTIDASRELEQCETVQRELETITDDLADLTNWIRTYSAKNDVIGRIQNEYDSVNKELQAIPICSECGRPLEDCDDRNR
jgi:DNA repair protein SbcC/Rad50